MNDNQSSSNTNSTDSDGVMTTDSVGEEVNGGKKKRSITTAKIDMERYNQLLAEQRYDEAVAMYTDQIAEIVDPRLWRNLTCPLLPVVPQSVKIVVTL